MQEIKIKPYTTSYKDTWNKFVSQSNQDTFLFHRDFMDYHSDRFLDLSLLIYKNNQLIALLPANKKNDEVFSHQGLTYGGLIYAMHLKTIDIIYSFKAILEFLNCQNIKNLIIKELPVIYLYNITNSSLQYFLFKIKAELFRTDTHTVLDNKYAKYTNLRKRGLKKGLKHQLKIEETDDFELFWNTILIPNLKSKHSIKPVHNLEEITYLKSRFNNNIRQFNVFHNNKIIGGTTIFETQNVAHCQYISGNADKNKLGSLDLLHIYLIENVFSHKQYFSFGISNVNDGKHINKGLQFWKEGFGARSITQGFYKIATKNYKLLDDVFL